MPISIKCQECGKIVIKPPSERNRKYCSAKCYGVSQRYINKNKCSIEHCSNFVKNRGFCNAHYLRLIRYGNPIGTKPATIRKKKIKPTPINNSICKQCGISFFTNRESRVVKCCSIKCFSDYRRKPFIIKKGYKKILIPDHPRADGKGYVFEHIIVLEAKVGRPLSSQEVTHHIDKNKLNNHPNNLIVINNNSIHIKEYH